MRLHSLLKDHRTGAWFSLRRISKPGFMNELAEPKTSPASVSQTHRRVISRPPSWWILFGVLLIGLLLRIEVAQVSGGLWPDELFSLAIATGHSLEHPAAEANPSLGDFVEPDHPVPAEEFRRYLQQDNPPASSGESLGRCCFPTRTRRSIISCCTAGPGFSARATWMLRLFSTACWLGCVPLIVGIARRTGGKPAVIPACVLFAFSPLAIYYSTEGRMYSLLWLCVLATTWASLLLQRGKGGVGIYGFWIVASAAGFLTHYFFIFPWLGIVAFLLVKPGKLSRLRLLGVPAANCRSDWPVVCSGTRKPSELAGDKGLAEMAAAEFQLCDRDAGYCFSVFLRDERHLWASRRTWNLLALILFAAVAALALWKMRRRAFARGRLLIGMTICGCLRWPARVRSLAAHLHDQCSAIRDRSLARSVSAGRGCAWLVRATR